jgi:hypothetical protein
MIHDGIGSKLRRDIADIKVQLRRPAAAGCIAKVKK